MKVIPQSPFPLLLLILLGIMTCGQHSVYGQCDTASDRRELIKLWLATDGPSWIRFNTWDTTQAMRTWSGISVNQAGIGCVTTIDLRNRGLKDSLPEFYLPYLESLRLDVNQLQGSIPDLNLPRLEFLSISGNQLTGPIPDFSYLQNLRGLFLSSNQLEGPIPDLDLPMLEDLWAYDNKLSGPIPDFSQLPRVDWIRLEYNQLSDSIPGFTNLLNLEILELDHNQLSGHIPNFTQLPNLTKLDVEHNELSGPIPDFSGLFSLTELRLGNNEFEGPVPNLSILSNLLNVWLDSNKLSGYFPDFNSFSRPRPPNARLESNKFVFKDILDAYVSFNSKNGFIKLNPQGVVGEDTIIAKSLGDSFDIVLPIDSPAIGNTYYWFKRNGGLLDSSLLPYYRMDSFSHTDVGDYHVTIKNPQVPVLTLYSSFFTLVVKPECNPTSDRRELIRLWQSTSGPNWSIPWDTTAAVRTWSGVQLNQDGCVIELDLSGKNLVGSIPDSLVLPRLQKLDFSGNLLFGSVTKFELMTDLQELNLAGNQLAGTLPGFNELSNLEVLNVSNNQLSGSLPIFNLPRLKNLLLNNNQFKDSIPDYAALEDLQRLDLSNNSLIGPIPDFSGHSNLTQLILNDNQLTGPLPNYGAVPSLLQLWLSNNQLSGPLPDFSNLSNLDLLLDQNNFTFNDLINNHANLPANTKLSPQKPIGNDTIIFKILGDSFDLTLPLKSATSGNKYKWFKNGQLIDSSFSRFFRIESFAVEDEGVYYATITNPLVPNLTLQSATLSLQEEVECDTEADRRELIKLWLNTNGLDWSSPWDTTLAVSLWNGVRLDRNGCVVSIDLGGRNLSGTIPSFKGLPKMESFWLDNNRLSGPLPDFSQLLSLTSLRLDGNHLTFKDLIEIYQSFSGSLDISPQKAISRDTILYSELSQPIELSLPLDSPARDNQYFWYKDGRLIDSSLTPNFSIASFRNQDVGIYHAVIKNPLIPELTLYSGTFPTLSEPQTILKIDSIPGVTNLFFDQVRWGDTDGDGFYDLLAYGKGGDGLAKKTLLFRNNDGKSFIPVRTFIPSVPDNLNIVALQWVDYDRDGDIDIAYQEASGDITIYSNETANRFYKVNVENLLTASKAFHLQGDWNADGYIDWLSADRSSTLLQDSLGRFTLRELGISDSGIFRWEHLKISISQDPFDKYPLSLLHTTDSVQQLYFKLGENVSSPNTLFGVSPNIDQVDVLAQDIDLDGSIDLGVGDGTSWTMWSQVTPELFIPKDSVSFINADSYMTISDIDLDGQNDRVRVEYTGQSLLNIYYGQRDRAAIFKTQVQLGDRLVSHPTWIDINGDGASDLSLVAFDPLTRSIKPMFVINQLVPTNTPPRAPRRLFSNVLNNQSGEVQLSWDPSYDLEVPTSGLTYQVYLSTRRGAVDRVSPRANILTGFRYDPTFKGNAFQNTFYNIRNLAPGRYYWSVQAIDHTGLGGTFAVRDSFVVNYGDRPDLTLNLVDIQPTRIAVGAELFFKSFIVNEGFSRTDSCVLAYYFSQDPTLDSSDYYLGSRWVPPLNSFDEVTIEAKEIIPPNIPGSFKSGEYFIIFKLDSADKIIESNKLNNLGRQLIFYDTNSPRIVNIQPKGNSFLSFDKKDEALNIDFEVTNPLATGKIWMVTEGISSNKKDTVDLSQNLTIVGNRTTGEVGFELNRPLFEADSQGLRYQILLVDTFGGFILSRSDWQNVYREYSSVDGLKLPVLSSVSQLTISQQLWDRKQAYNIVAFPLFAEGGKKVDEVLFDDLGGSYTKRNWRLFGMNPNEGEKGQIQYKEYNTEGFEKLNHSQGYLLILRNQPEDLITTGPGRFPAVKIESNWTEIALETGWNLIGNPYNFHLNWREVVEHNALLDSSSNACIFDQGFKSIEEADIPYQWRRFSGLLVWAERPGIIHIPVKMDSCFQDEVICSGVRRIAKQQLSDLSREHWELQLQASVNGERASNLTIGMHPMAKINFDRLDRLSPPITFEDEMRVSISHPEHSWGLFSKDLVPRVENYTWTLNYLQVPKKGHLNLQWDPDLFGDNNYTLAIWDKDNQRLIDLRKQASYLIKLARSSKIQLIFLSKKAMDNWQPTQAMLSQPYPNPNQGTFMIPFSITRLEEGQKISCHIRNSLAETVWEWSGAKYEEGFYEIRVPQLNLPRGIYTVELRVGGKKLGIKKIEVLH